MQRAMPICIVTEKSTWTVSAFYLSRHLNWSEISSVNEGKDANRRYFVPAAVSCCVSTTHVCHAIAVLCPPSPLFVGAWSLTRSTVIYLSHQVNFSTSLIRGEEVNYQIAQLVYNRPGCEKLPKLQCYNVEWGWWLERLYWCWIEFRFSVITIVSPTVQFFKIKQL